MFDRIFAHPGKSAVTVWLLAALASLAAGAVVQAYALTGMIVPLALLLLSGIVFAEIRRGSAAGRLSLRYHRVISGILLGALAGGVLALFISPDLHPTGLGIMLRLLYLGMGIALLHRPAGLDEHSRQ